MEPMNNGNAKKVIKGLCSYYLRYSLFLFGRYETVERVVNGTYNMQKNWIEHHRLGWNPWKAQKSAQEMFTRIYEMKFLPPGRGNHFVKSNKERKGE